MSNLIKLAIVDDQHLFRTGLISLLKEFDEFQIVIEASNGKELTGRIDNHIPDVILLDIEMPIMDGFKTLDYLKKYYPEIKILILTMYNDEEIKNHFISKGANGFLLKNDNIETIRNAISAAIENGYYYSDMVSKSLVQELTCSKNNKPYIKKVNLSEREIQVIKMICKEYTNKEIADKLFVSVRTVDGHREKILNKTKAKNTAGIVMFAVKNKLFYLPKIKMVI